MASHDHEGIPILPPEKKRRLTSFSKCVICQGDKNEVLRKGKESSVETFISALSLRHDEVYERLYSEISDRKDLELFWHSSCYSSYTSQQNIRYATSSNVSAPLLTEDSGNTEDRRLSRSAIAPTDWSCCLFCCNKTHKKVREMQSVCTLGACQTIKEAAESKCDERMLHILRGVNNELIAAEAKYHKSCFASYVSKSNLKHQTFREKDGESLYHEAFQGLAESISDGIARGRAYDMVSLLSMYKGLLANKEINASSYTTQHLKKRLQHRFTTSIVFHQPSDKSKPELVYSSQISVQDVINAAVTRPTTPEAAGAMDKTQQIFHTAKIIKNEIKACKGISIRPLNINDINLESAKSIVPQSSYLFFALDHCL